MEMLNGRSGRMGYLPKGNGVVKKVNVSMKLKKNVVPFE